MILFYNNKIFYVLKCIISIMWLMFSVALSFNEKKDRTVQEIR